MLNYQPGGVAVNDRSIKVFMHTIVNYDHANEKDIIDSVQNWSILNDGRVKKR